MSESSLRVLVVGGGLGGLCLAQGLREAGGDVRIYERDASPVFRGQGYRVHIDSRGERALQECLPTRLYELFEATCGQPSNGLIMFAVADRQLKEAYVRRFPEGDSPELITTGSAVNRLTLREVLLAGLDDVARFGKEFTRYEQRGNGSVCAYFADGTSAVGDVLVAADGVGSRIRQQFLPHARVIDTGLRWLGGKTLLTDETKPLLPAQLYEGFAGFVIGGETMPAKFLATVQFQREPNEAATQLWSSLRFHDTDDYFMWGVIARRERLPCSDDDLSAMDGAELRQVALEMTEGWPPSLRTLVHNCELEQTFFLTVRSSVPIEHWQTTNVTLLGDAIHAMPPSRGSGANTALRDASLLCRNLAAADRREKPLLQAIHDYEAQMVRYGFDAVQASLRTLPKATGTPSTRRAHDGSPPEANHLVPTWSSPHRRHRPASQNRHAGHGPVPYAYSRRFTVPIPAGIVVPVVKGREAARVV